MRGQVRAGCLAVCGVISVACGQGREGGHIQPDASAPGSVELSIDPPSATVESGASARFTATVTGGSDQDVIWSADAGTIDQSGRYTAPLTAGTFHVVATSRAHPAASATAVVSVASLSVALSPKTVT